MLDRAIQRIHIRHMAMSRVIQDLIEAPLLERSRAIMAGVPAAALRELVREPPLTLSAVAKVVAPRRTLDRRLKENGKLSPEEGDRLARFAGILSLCEHIFGSRVEALEWLEAPKRRFDGQRPIDLLRTDAGGRLVEQVLVQSQYGMTA